ncbi:MAG: pitrilysin family protein [Planctomycetota bacterium]|nr:pitrilysin family protein [Planctomycetota bacterium]
MDIPFEKHELGNGLQVVLHSDRSAPLAAVYVYYHVGSAREERGRSGFAHLFEHMLFQGSEHVPESDHFRLIQEAGGTLNGTTSEDRTNYFETLPSNHLELALWLESDRMGFLLPAMTQAKLDNQRDVVKNERRQSYDNRPYGLVRETLRKEIFPVEHPLHWTPIGSMEDLDRAGLEDVAAFFRRWYGPNNATLAIGGDFEPSHALALAERWFGPLPRGPEVHPLAPQPSPLAETRRVTLQDRVQIPQVTLAWPTVPSWHPDEAALNLLADVLSANRSSVLDRALLIDEELAARVTILHRALEVAGILTIDLRPRPGVTLETLERRTDELIREAVERGIEPERLQRLKTAREAQVLVALDTVSARTNALAHYNTFRGDPGALAADLARHDAVTPEEVACVAREYLIDRPRVVLSVVPREADA